MLVRESLNESGAKAPIVYEKLVEYAKGIAICCHGEYGDTFYNEAEQHIYICLGDSNPFDESMLEEYIKDAVTKSYDDYKKVKVTIENECSPQGAEWIKIKI